VTKVEQRINEGVYLSGTPTFSREDTTVDETSESTIQQQIQQRPVQVAAGAVMLEGTLSIPANSRRIVLFAHSNSSSPDTPPDVYNDMAGLFHESGFATLLVNLLTAEDEALDRETGFFRENVDVLHQRIIGAANWLLENRETENLRIGYFGAGVAGAAALVAAAERPDAVVAVVSCAGRTDLAEPYLSRVIAPTLFIVGENDSQSVDRNRKALESLTVDKQLETIGSVTNLFEKFETLREVARLACGWFERYIPESG